MAVDRHIILSILVISHNQSLLLTRCINTLLDQEIDFPYEIIISDDASTDNTWKVIIGFMNQYPELIFGTQINSDDCNPVNRSERCGYNKANAYKHSRGKYFVNIDADDYLLGTDVYQKQIELLENHTECSMCMQNIWVVNDGDDLEKGKLWDLGRVLVNEEILNAKEIILQSLRVLNQGYMIRRIETIDPIAIYRKQYDDTIITYHHLQFGKVIFLDRHDYIYVKYASSIDSSLQKDNRELIYSLLPIHHIYFIPKFAGFFFKNGLTGFIHLLKLCSEKKMDIDGETKAYLSEFNGYLYEYFQRKNVRIFDDFRLYFIRILLLSLKKWSIESPVLYRLTFAFMTNYKEMMKIPKELWRIN
jgi:glycosyltransferase involved in cell wall biosynthesis